MRKFFYFITFFHDIFKMVITPLKTYTIENTIISWYFSNMYLPRTLLIKINQKFYTTLHMIANSFISSPFDIRKQFFK